MAYSAYPDKAQIPDRADLPRVLGESTALWNQLISQLAADYEPLAEDWVSSGRKWGWALRLKQKKRAVLYMTPADGFFRVGLALGEKAAQAALESDLPAPLLDVVDTAPKDAERRGVRFEVKTLEDVDGALEIARKKMMN